MTTPILLTAPVNADLAWTITLSGPTGSTWPYTSADALECDVYSGNGLAILFSPTVTWYTNALDQKVQIRITAAQTASLQTGEYPLQGFILPAGTSTRIPWPAGALTLTAAAGTGTLAPVYTTYARMVELAPWVAQCFDPAVHQVGFQRERATARAIFDNLVVRLYRNTSTGLFGSLTVAANSWAGGATRRTMLPSKIMQQYLANNLLIVNDQVDRINAWLAIAEVGRQQVGVNNQLARYGQAAAECASSEISVCTALIAPNGDGVATIPVPLGASNPFFT